MSERVTRWYRLGDGGGPITAEEAAANPLNAGLAASARRTLAQVDAHRALNEGSLEDALVAIADSGVSLFESPEKPMEWLNGLAMIDAYRNRNVLQACLDDYAAVKRKRHASRWPSGLPERYRLRKWRDAHRREQRWRMG